MNTSIKNIPHNPNGNKLPANFYSSTETKDNDDSPYFSKDYKELKEEMLGGTSQETKKSKDDELLNSKSSKTAIEKIQKTAQEAIQKEVQEAVEQIQKNDTKIQKLAIKQKDDLANPTQYDAKIKDLQGKNTALLEGAHKDKIKEKLDEFDKKAEADIKENNKKIRSLQANLQQDPETKANNDATIKHLRETNDKLLNEIHNNETKKKIRNSYIKKMEAEADKIIKDAETNPHPNPDFDEDDKQVEYKKATDIYLEIARKQKYANNDDKAKELAKKAVDVFLKQDKYDDAGATLNDYGVLMEYVNAEEKKDSKDPKEVSLRAVKLLIGAAKNTSDDSKANKHYENAAIILTKLKHTAGNDDATKEIYKYLEDTSAQKTKIKDGLGTALAKIPEIQEKRQQLLELVYQKNTLLKNIEARVNPDKSYDLSKLTNIEKNELYLLDLKIKLFNSKETTESKDLKNKIKNLEDYNELLVTKERIENGIEYLEKSINTIKKKYRIDYYILKRYTESEKIYNNMITDLRNKLKVIDSKLQNVTNPISDVCNNPVASIPDLIASINTIEINTKTEINDNAIKNYTALKDNLKTHSVIGDNKASQTALYVKSSNPFDYNTTTTDIKNIIKLTIDNGYAFTNYNIENIKGDIIVKTHFQNPKNYKPTDENLNEFLYNEFNQKFYFYNSVGKSTQELNFNQKNQPLNEPKKQIEQILKDINDFKWFTYQELGNLFELKDAKLDDKDELPTDIELAILHLYTVYIKVIMKNPQHYCKSENWNKILEMVSTSNNLTILKEPEKKATTTLDENTNKTELVELVDCGSLYMKIQDKLQAYFEDQISQDELQHELQRKMLTHTLYTS